MQQIYIFKQCSETFYMAKMQEIIVNLKKRDEFLWTEKI
jgi:hypothetical protein